MYTLLFFLKLQYCVAEAYVIVLAYYFEACFVKYFEINFAIVHLAIAVGHSGKVERGHLQAESAGFILLAVPKGFVDNDAAIVLQHIVAFLQYGHNLCIGKTIQELAHEYEVVSMGQQPGALQYIYRMVSDPAAKASRINDLFCFVKLHWQVQKADVDIGVVFGTCQGPFTGVGANIQYAGRGMFEHKWKYIGESQVGVIVIKGKPAALGWFGQRRQPLVYGIPVAQVFQAIWLAIHDGSFEVNGSRFTHIAHEICIDAGHRVVDKNRRPIPSPASISTLTP